MLKVKSVASKCDADNSHWGSRDMWFVYDDTNELSLPVAWAQYELKYPCAPSQRTAWPAVSPHGNDKAYTTSTAANDHKQLCGTALGEEGRKITPHAHRVTLATAIMALPDTDEPTAQALVRWKTVESLRTYYKMMPTRYADVANRATKVDAAKESNIRIPEIEPSGPLERIDEAIKEFERAGDGATRKGRTGDVDASDKRGGNSIARFLVDQTARGKPIYMNADTTDDPNGVIGLTVAMPNESWTGWERCASKCARRKKGGMCEQCKRATARTTCTVAAFSESEALYVLDAEGQHYAFRYDQIAPHLSKAALKRAAKERTGDERPPTKSGRRK